MNFMGFFQGFGGFLGDLFIFGNVNSSWELFVNVF